MQTDQLVFTLTDLFRIRFEMIWLHGTQMRLIGCTLIGITNIIGAARIMTEVAKLLLILAASIMSQRQDTNSNVLPIL